MINSISEGSLRVTTKVDPSSVIHDKEVRQEKEQAIVEARAIDPSEAGENTKKRQAQEDQEGTSRFIRDQQKMVFEKYDKDGNVVLRIPPSTTPVDEKA